MLKIASAPPSFAELRAREFSRLDAKHQVYLDYTGSALYGESQLRAHHELLREGLFGNPHSEHGPSRASAAVIDAAREMVLRWFDVMRQARRGKLSVRSRQHLCAVRRQSQLGQRHPRVRPA